MSDIEAGSQKSSNVPATQNSEIVMTVAETTNECTSREQSYVRQTSMFEDKEGQGLMRTGVVDVSSNHNTCDNLTGKNKVLIKPGNSRVSRENNKQVDTSLNMKHSCAQNNDAEKEKKQHRPVTCRKCIGKVVPLFLSLMAIAGVLYLYCDRNGTVEPVTPDPPGQSLAIQEHPRKITGRFKLDQNAFSSSNKTHIRWTSASERNNLITASPDAPCLVVPERGTYGVFSVIAFSIYTDDDVTKLAHFIRLEGYQTGEQHFQRKIFAVPVPENRNNPEIIQSTLISFPGMEANGRICVYTADSKMKYLYSSPIDSTINIFKV